MIEEELQVYRRLQDADPFELQEKILRTIGYEEGEINSITAEAQDPLLTNCSLIELVERRMEKTVKIESRRYDAKVCNKKCCFASLVFKTQM